MGFLKGFLGELNVGGFSKVKKKQGTETKIGSDGIEWMDGYMVHMAWFLLYDDLRLPHLLQLRRVRLVIYINLWGVIFWMWDIFIGCF